MTCFTTHCKAYCYIDWLKNQTDLAYVLILLAGLIIRYELRFILRIIFVEKEILFNLEVCQSEVARIDRDIEAIICALFTVIFGSLCLTRFILFELYPIGSIRCQILVLSQHDHAEAERTPLSQSF